MKSTRQIFLRAPLVWLLSDYVAAVHDCSGGTQSRVYVSSVSGASFDDV